MDAADGLPPRDAELERRLEEALGPTRLGRPCLAFATASSTMDVAHALARRGAGEGTCVWAEQQVAGRGRAGRSWSSPPGGVYCSLVVRPPCLPDDAPQLALVAGLATAQAVQATTGLPTCLRWPNDVVIDGRKIAGILVEAQSEGARLSYAIIGIGINVATDPQALEAPAASLSEWRRPPPDRVALAAQVLRVLEQLYETWSREGFPAIRPRILASWELSGRVVRVTTAQGHVEGQASDVDERGRLIVRIDSGVLRAFEAGDVVLLR